MEEATGKRKWKIIKSYWAHLSAGRDCAQLLEKKRKEKRADLVSLHTSKNCKRHLSKWVTFSWENFFFCRSIYDDYLNLVWITETEIYLTFPGQLQSQWMQLMFCSHTSVSTLPGLFQVPPLQSLFITLNIQFPFMLLTGPTTISFCFTLYSSHSQSSTLGFSHGSSLDILLQDINVHFQV